MIRMEGLSVRIGRKPILEDISLDFEPGTVTVLLGPNGSGKTTLLRAALGLIPSSGGRILIDGIPLDKLSRREIAGKAAFLPQSRPQASIQALRMVLHGRFPYLSYPRRYSREDLETARAAMDAVGCRRFEEVNIQNLSGGERQSVYLAMALAQQTETILMDEPTTYLDVRHQLRIMAMARELAAEGKAVVMVLHDIALALRCADQAAVLENGHLVMAGTPAFVYDSGVLDRVFGVCVRRLETPDGPQYYCAEKEGC